MSSEADEYRGITVLESCEDALSWALVRLTQRLKRLTQKGKVSITARKEIV